MEVETEPDSNWSESVRSGAETPEAHTEHSEDFPDKQNPDDEDTESVTSSTNTSVNQTHRASRSEPDGPVTSTNGPDSDKASSTAAAAAVEESGSKSPKSPITALSLQETVAKLRKTISSVRFPFKPPNVDPGSGPGSPDLRDEPQTEKLTSHLPNGADGEHSDKDIPDEQAAESRAARNSTEEVPEDPEDAPGDEMDTTDRADGEAEAADVDASGSRDTDDDDSLRTPDPSSLSESVMNLVDPVISDHDDKSKQAAETETPTVHITIPSPGKPTPIVSPVIKSPVLSPKSVDHESAVLSHVPSLGLFKCDARTCGIKTNKESVIKAHIEQHTGANNVWYRCLYCSTITKTTENIRKHLQKFHVTDTLKFSRLTSPSVHEVFQSLVGEAKKDSSAGIQVEKPKSGVNGPEDNLVVIEDEDEADTETSQEPDPKKAAENASAAIAASSAPVIKKSSADNVVKQGYTTRLECFFKDQFYRCKICAFKDQNAEVFASHAYCHLHGKDGKKGLASCGAANKPHGVADCKVVKEMMSLLKKQKDGTIQPAAAAGSKPQAAANRSQASRSLLAKPAAQAQNGSAFGMTQTQAVGQRLVIVPANKPSAAKSPAAPTAAPSAAVLSPTEQTVFPPYKSPGSTGAQSSSKAPVLQQIPVPTIPDSEDHVEEFAEMEVDPATSKDEEVTLARRPYTSAIISLNVNNEVKVQKPNEKPEPGKKILKCVYRNECYVCLTCRFECAAVKPELFRKHLWRDVHPKHQCAHCESDVTFNKFRKCPVLDELMSRLEDEVIQSMEQPITEAAEPDEAPGPGADPDAQAESAKQAGEEEEEAAAPEEAAKESEDSDANGENFSDVINMLKDLNEGKEQKTEKQTEQVIVNVLHSGVFCYYLCRSKVSKYSTSNSVLQASRLQDDLTLAVMSVSESW